MLQNVRVLVVDDSEDSRACVQRMLAGAGYEVLEADNGRAALRMLASDHFDLILADIAMPDINGYQLFERVSQDPRWVRIPFVFITARTFDSDIRYGKSLGVDATSPSPSARPISSVLWRARCSGRGAEGWTRRPPSLPRSQRARAWTLGVCGSTPTGSPCSTQARTSSCQAVSFGSCSASQRTAVASSQWRSW